MKSNIVVALIFFFILGCGHTQIKQGDLSNGKCSEGLEELYFSDWNTCLECALRLSSEDHNEKDTQLANFILGEDSFLKYDEKKAAYYFFKALDGSDGAVSEASLQYIKRLYLNLGMIEDFIKIDTKHVQDAHVRVLVDLERLKWSLALDRKSVFKKIRTQILIPGKSNLYMSVENGLKNDVKEVVPSMNGVINLQNYFSEVHGKDFNLEGEFYLSEEKELSVFSITNMTNEIFVDGLKVRNREPFVLSEGNHKIVVKLKPKKGEGTDISLFLPFYDAKVSSPEKGENTGRCSFTEADRKESSSLIKYVGLLNKKTSSTDDYFTLYSSKIGSFPAPFIFNLAMASIDERSVERGLSYLRQILDRKDYLRPKLKIMEWLLYTGRKSELENFEKKFPVQKDNFHVMLFNLDRFSFYKQYLAGLALSERLIEKFDDNPVSYYYLAGAYEDLRYFKQALNIRLSLLEKMPYHSPVLSSIGTISEPLEDLDILEKVVNRRLKRDPDSIFLKHKLAKVSFKRKDYEKAEYIYDNILNTLNNDLYSLLGKGDLAFIQGNREDAGKYYTKAFIIYPENSAAAKKASLFQNTDHSEYFKKHSRSDGEVFKITQEYSGDDSIPYVVIYDEGNYRVVNHNLIVARFRMAIKVNTEKAVKEFAQTEYSGELLNALIIRDGKKIKVQKSKEGLINFSGLKPGDIIDYSFLTSIKNDYWLKGFSDSWLFSNIGTLYHKSEVSVFIPDGMKFNYYISKGVKEPVIKLEKDGKVYFFSENDIAMPLEEKNMPDQFSLIPNLQFSVINSWNDFAKWQSKVIEENGVITKSIEQKTFSIIKSDDGPLSMVSKLRDYVAGEIKYRSIDPDELSVLPESADETLKRASGDCKDKALLLKTMLEAVGIKSQYVLVKSKFAGPFIKEIPSMQFDHALIYIPKQEKIKTEGFFVDPTSGYDFSLGLNRALVGVEAMVIDEQEASYIFIPVKENITGMADFSLKTTGKSSIVFYGTSASMMRFRLASGKSPEQGMAGYFKNILKDFEIKDRNTDNPSLIFTAAFNGEFPEVVSSLYSEVLSGLSRKYPLALPYLSEVISFTLKSDSKINFEQDNRFFSYSVRNEGDSTIRVEFVIKKWIIDVEEFAELEKSVINVMMFEKKMREGADG